MKTYEQEKTIFFSFDNSIR